jgi:hypothetical protein
MANEINASVTLIVAKNSDDFQVLASDTFDMSGTYWSRQRAVLTTTEAALDDGSITTGNQGYIYVKARETNSDAVLIGVKPAGSFIECQRLWPGQAVLCRGGVNDVYAKANSVTQVIDFAIVES